MKEKDFKQAYPPLKIQDWAEEDRPRERLMKLGSENLSEAELLGILIGSGVQHVSAVDLAKHILQAHNNSLEELSKRSVVELLKFKGIGQAKAVVIVSAMELAKRKNHNLPKSAEKITSSEETYALMKTRLLGKITEEFWIILLNKNNRIIKVLPISKGGLSTTSVDSRVIFKKALDHNAIGIVLVHNHPGGSLT
ncbi:MAG: UPF0758 domain-containing protein, partial [Bacteroidota bacterium]